MVQADRRNWRKKYLKVRYGMYLCILAFCLWYFLGERQPGVESGLLADIPPGSGIKFKGDYQIELIAEGRKVEPFRILADGDPIFVDRFEKNIPGGYTEITFTVTPDGDVQAVRVTNTCGDGTFDNRARRALESWTYSAWKEEAITVRVHWSEAPPLIKIGAVPRFNARRNIRRQVSSSANFRISKM